jgi:hypothetical protein
MKERRRILIREVLVHLGIEGDPMLDQLRDQGLFESDELSPYEADELRVATLLIQEMGVNPEGVQVALHLRRRLLALEARATAIVDQMRNAAGD